MTIAFEFEPRFGPLGWLVSRYLTYRVPGLVDAVFDRWAAEITARSRTPGDRDTERADRRTAGESDIGAKRRLLPVRVPVRGAAARRSTAHRRPGLLGRRDARLSFVHGDDVGRAFADAIDREATGTFHVVDDEPAPYGGSLQTFAEALEAPAPRRVPAWLAR